MSSHFSSGRTGAPKSGTQVKARVKWFNQTKGFGFVAPEDGSADAFLHISALQRYGAAHLAEQAEVLCEVAPGPKGPQVIRILNIEMPEGGETLAGGPAGGDQLAGSVKWFAADKGFGFIVCDDGGKDVFVHKSILRRCGLETLEEGQRVQVTAATTPKGREATWIGMAD